MPTMTIPQIALSFQLGGTEYACQVITASVTLPGWSTGETIEVACPDGRVIEPGEHVDGSLSGEVFTDTTDTGITWALMQAHQTQATLPYTLTWFADQANNVAFTVTGEAQVGGFTLAWSKPGNSRHDLDLTLLSADLGRP